MAWIFEVFPAVNGRNWVAECPLCRAFVGRGRRDDQLGSAVDHRAQLNRWRTEALAGRLLNACGIQPALRQQLR